MRLLGWTSLGLTTYLWSGFRISYFGLFLTQRPNLIASLSKLFCSIYTTITLASHFPSLSIFSVSLCTFQQPSSSFASLICSLIISGESWLLLWLVVWGPMLLLLSGCFSWEWVVVRVTLELAPRFRRDVRQSGVG